MRRKRLETARWGAVSDRGHSAAFSRFLRDSEKTSRKSVTPREPRALGCTLSPPRMTRALLISWVACLVTTHQARLIDRCDLAKLLHQEDMDGFEGYSLSDCECHLLTALISSSPGQSYVTIFLSLFCLANKLKTQPSPRNLSQHPIFT